LVLNKQASKQPQKVLQIPTNSHQQTIRCHAHKSPPIHQITETDPAVSFTLSGQQQQMRAHKKIKNKKTSC
jgi:hypothetical protein